VDIQSAWDLAVERAKLENFRMHDLRHTAASHLAMSGATLAELSEVLGHKTLQMVKRYSHLTEGHTGDLLERMGDRMFKTGGKKNEKKKG
jgi:integrase